ncbi:NAD-dependent epimerase/dehydratase family protein [Flexibacterium corallicola]|uniref:NAD-dependent epimerase/dehydratase family protein n=1 Tax=Flexibacterium corallicola TaxID=3037259 RepID=UPI00286ED835|nr:NAD-dependent epimerase/dehydratase family protein [Pseudovibrio sp. M1P-2-3]
MFKRILITGGCGFIGVNLISALVEANISEEIIVLDNEITGKSSSLRGVTHQFIKGDIRDHHSVDDAMIGVDAVVHLAADTRVIDSIKNPTYNFEVNVKGTLNILEAMRKNGVSQLINSSTGGAIIGCVTPPVHEKMPVNPASAYGAAKAAAEAYCSAYSQSYGLAVTSLRFSNVYGPCSLHKGSVIAAFMRNILSGEPCNVYGNGDQTRDFIFVNDLCFGIISALRLKLSGVFQLGSGHATSVNEIITLLKTVTGVKHDFEVRYHDFRAGEVRDNFADISKAAKALRFHPKTSLEIGMGKTWEYFWKNREVFRRVQRHKVMQDAN